MARNAQSILSTAYSKLRDLLAEAEQANFAVAEQVRYLKDELDQSFRAISKQLGVSPNGKPKYSHVYVGDLYKAANHPVRLKGASLNQHIVAAKSQKRAEDKITRETGSPFKFNPKQVIEDVVKNGFPRVRQATDYLVNMGREKVAPMELQKSIEIATKSSGIIDRCHHCDWRRIIPDIKPGSVRLFLLDPPYAGYTKTANGKLHLYGSTSAELIGCNNNTTAEAKREVCDCFRLLVPLIHPNGVLALWQRGNWPWSEAAIASEQNGWVPYPPFVWDKREPQPTDFESPSYSVEFCWLFARPGARLSNFNGSSRQQVLSADEFPPMKGTKRHLMQKPECLSTHLIEKVTREGDIVAELFGCSGSGSIAAIRSRRHFIYTESHPENFEFGASRIGEEMSLAAKSEAMRKSA